MFALINQSHQRPSQHPSYAAFGQAFDGEPDLLQRVLDATLGGPSTPQSLLLQDIATYILRLKHTTHAPAPPQYPILGSNGAAEPTSKKRKLVEDEPIHCTNATITQSMRKFVAQDVSFTLPRKKKLRLEVYGKEGASTGAVLGIVGASGEREVEIALGDVDHIICVPVPERAQPAFHFILIPSPSSQTTPPEPIVFTVPATPPKNVEFIGSNEAVEDGESFDQLVRRVFDKELAGPGRKRRVVMPDAKEFVSGVVQAHRKGEKACFVKAYRGSKDGYLYFLPPGILFGFRKPLLFYPLHVITSISYSSILQRTFNLNLSVSLSGGGDEEIEFAMLDQADFAGVDGYVKGHGLHDASLAEGRRARHLGVNGLGKVGDEGVDGKGDEEEGELARAERELQDREDEEEEDFEPSEGSSEGSGEESEGEEGEGEGEGDGSDGEGEGEDFETDGEEEQILEDTDR